MSRTQLDDSKAKNNQSTSAPVRQWTARLLMLFGWVIPIIVFACVALFAPVDVLDRLPWLNEASSSIESIAKRVLPKVDFFRHARSTAFPQVATLATSLALFVWPWMTAITLALTAMTTAEIRRPVAAMGSKKLFWLSLVLPAFAALCLYSFFALPGDPSFSKGLTSGSRDGYAFMGSAALAFGSFGFGLWPITVITLIVDILFGRNNHD